MSPIKITFKIQYFDKKLGYWIDLKTYNNGLYDIAVADFKKEDNLDNTRPYRLIQIKEELIDSLFPLGS